MTYKDLLVHLDGSERAAVRLDVAVLLAHRFGGRLSGVFGESDPHVLIPATRAPEVALAQNAAAARTMFVAKTEAAGITAEWSPALTVNDTELLNRLMFKARHADLVIVGQNDPEHPEVGVPADLAEHLVLNSGRPALIIPYAGAFSNGERIMVAWNGSREASRAVSDAMPLLREARYVVVVAINPELARKDYGEDPWPAIERHLLAHEVRRNRNVVGPGHECDGHPVVACGRSRD